APVAGGAKFRQSRPAQPGQATQASLAVASLGQDPALRPSAAGLSGAIARPVRGAPIMDPLPGRTRGRTGVFPAQFGIIRLIPLPELRLAILETHARTAELGEP